MAQSLLNGTTQPVEIEEEGRSSTTDREWVGGLKIAMPEDKPKKG